MIVHARNPHYFTLALSLCGEAVVSWTPGFGTEWTINEVGDVDTVTCERCLEALAKRVERVIAPVVHYNPPLCRPGDTAAVQTTVHGDVTCYRCRAALR